jgi:hypothetical protein
VGAGRGNRYWETVSVPFNFIQSVYTSWGAAITVVNFRNMSVTPEKNPVFTCSQSIVSKPASRRLLSACNLPVLDISYQYNCTGCGLAWHLLLPVVHACCSMCQNFVSPDCWLMLATDLLRGMHPFRGWAFECPLSGMNIYVRGFCGRFVFFSLESVHF